MTHADIFERLSASGTKPGKVTLYRVLFAFSDVRIVHKIQGIDSSVRFCIHEASVKNCPGNHPHFFCRKCGRMMCLNGQPLPNVKVPEGMSADGKQLIIFGLCPQCADG